MSNLGWCAVLLFSTLLATCQSQEDAAECAKQQKVRALLDMTEETLDKAKDHIPNCNGGGRGVFESAGVGSGGVDGRQVNTSNCRERGKILAFLDIASNFVSNIKGNYSSCTVTQSPAVHQKPMDCQELLENGHKKNGVYRIWPRSRHYCNRSLEVYCDMDTDGGGWTVIRKTGNLSLASPDERNKWNSKEIEFEYGFGNLTQDFYIGHKNIQVLSNQGLYGLRTETTDTSGIKYVVIFDMFWMDDRGNYTTHSGKYRIMGNPSAVNHSSISSDIFSIRRTCT